ncbi:hypothetical protein FPOAC1_008516 [Fusarium poae]|uniref:hypothetical protein n=1 Tax=Fusarium poae TaxID=36050 RepID=UPI001CEA039D|nr:hypothetical protein FPOAC1_008516 [Fusarium poae]KAG8669128.1 hypothetical protein FPOAC1_008516 [Fusarium poae]
MVTTPSNNPRLSRSLFPTPKGRVVILNGASASTKAAVLGALEPQLVDSKTQIVDSYIMTNTASLDLIERELRSHAQVRMSTKAKTFDAIKHEVSNFPRVGSERRIGKGQATEKLWTSITVSV